MLSFWEQDVFLTYDHIVIGGGIVGLSTAVSIKEKDSSKKVLVLEKGIFPSGASTKNAGFSCFGSLTEILADLDTMSQEEVVELVNVRWNGLGLLKQRLGAEHIDFHQWGGYELLVGDQVNALDQMDEVNDLLFPLFDAQVYHNRHEKIKTFGFNESHVDHMVFNPFEGQIHTGKMMKRLQAYAASLGVEVFTGVEVQSILEEDKSVQVVINDELSFRADRVAICTNAFSKKLLPDLALSPGRGLVLITKPVPGLPFQGTFHYDEGYYYFRNYQDRVIFGGGRNLAHEEEETTDFGINQKILKKLKEDLHELILPEQSVEIAHFWSGIMAFGQNKQPLLKRHSDRLYLGVRLGGMGVAIGSQLGLELAEMMLTSE